MFGARAAQRTLASMPTSRPLRFASHLREEGRRRRGMGGVSISGCVTRQGG